jgi:hypothetical protein
MIKRGGWMDGDAEEVRPLDYLIIILTAGVVMGLILAARGTQLPMHGVNDLSRWATVYSLAERGTYQIDETPWPPTIDRVQLSGHTYSSKPPLLPTLLAGEYLLIKKLSFGRLNFHDAPESVIRIIVITVNLFPFVLFLVLYSRLLDRLAGHPWIRLYALLAAGLGTYLTAYSTTLNNHTVAAFSCFFSFYPAYRIWYEGRREWRYFALSGFFAGFTAVNEFPALSFLGVLGLALMWKAPRKVFFFFIPLALLPVLGHLYTNYLVTGTWKPAYAHIEAYDFPGSYWKIDPASGRLVGSRVDPKTGQTVLQFPEGIDNQFEPWYLYLFHMLIGHHGIFSLSPIFILSFLGLRRSLGPQSPAVSGDQPLGLLADLPIEDRNRPADSLSEKLDRGAQVSPGVVPMPALRFFAYVTLGLTIELLIFYIFLAGQRNYGGICNGLRWVFWLIPLWLLFLPLGLAGWVSRRRFRAIALVFLLISAASVFYASRNPWTRPWLQQWLYYHHWIQY